ncbi:MAG: hypothetical protein IPJ17_18650 [Holophagales bacterium]|nr:MAG: hypothetical protein IPJ17_18650 [Holophagales bacterium]
MPPAHLLSKSLATLLAGATCSIAGAATAATPAAPPREPSRIDDAQRTPEGLVGNGRSVVRVRPDGFSFHSGGDASARFRLRLGGVVSELGGRPGGASFFPGGVVYRLALAGARIEILHGALPQVPYLVAFRVTGASEPVGLEVEATGAPTLEPSGDLSIPLERGAGELVLAAGGPRPAGSWEELRRRIEAPDREGLLLGTPSPQIDRAVPFSRALLDLGFDGKLHVCELFRWRDVWSRDLGSGLVPGAMASGRFAAARTTLAYDLRRYASADPRGLKVTEDPSQGGTAEGTAWLTRAVWRDFLLTGDRAALADAERTLRPWVEAWIDRDPDERGLLVDVSEWMDHSRFFLLPDGARVLYSTVLFAELLHTFGKVERALGDAAAARRYEAIGDRFVRGINHGLWDEALGAYDNLELWGRRDERVAAAENALAVLAGVAPRARAVRALATVKARSWRAAGSTTIVPPMRHVPESNDHNYKMWPWWNAVEARARFRTGDAAGGVHLLESGARTLEDEHFPGMMEELTSPEGVSEGGSAFLTAAGAYLDAVVEGLLGIEILEPGCARLRVAPQVPGDWHDWHAEVPLPEGGIALSATSGRLRIRVTDPRVQVVEAPPDAIVEGARHVAVTPLGEPSLAGGEMTGLPSLPPPQPRCAAVLVTDGLTGPLAPGLPAARLAPRDLTDVDPATVGAIVVPGNALPRRTEEGADVQAALARYLDRGGALVFFGATMRPRGTMGEYGGVIDWFERQPAVRDTPIDGWELHPSPDGPATPPEAETGRRSGWHLPGSGGGSDEGWRKIAVPAAWEQELGHELDGWAWYRAHFSLPAEARGRVVVLNLGRIDDEDWTWVNGQPVGARRHWRTIRRYRIQPGEPAYATLVFGGENLVAVRVLDHGGAGGMTIDTPRVGFETADLTWQPIDPMTGDVADQPIRHAVVSWGPGGAFFNSWETSRGAFGFAIDGRGVSFTGPLAGLADLDIAVHEAFTDFAVSRPWRFEPLAFTETDRHLLIPDHGERYPCAARLVNTATGGEIVLLPASIAATPAGAALLDRLRLGVTP